MFHFGERISPRPWIIGHRGAMGHAPENSLASFNLAKNMGADFVECDVHLSKDKKCIVMHDESVERTTNGYGLIRDLSSAEIKKLDCGAWYSKKFKGEKVLILDELLLWVKNQSSFAGNPMGLVIEIKNEPVRYLGIEKMVLEAVKRNGMGDRVILISFDHGAVKRAKQIDRSIPAGILYNRPLEDPFKRAREVDADALFPRRHMITKSLVNRARKNKYFIATWTVNEEEEMKKIAAAGIDAIASNFPDRLNKILSLTRILQ